MKNIIFAATAMIVAMTAVSCSKVAGIEENPSYTYRFAVVNEELPSVKSDMSSDHLVFETGDYLGFSLEKKGRLPIPRGHPYRQPSHVRFSGLLRILR